MVNYISKVWGDYILYFKISEYEFYSLKFEVFEFYILMFQNLDFIFKV